MAPQGWKRLALAGLLGALGLTVGCNDRREGTVRDEARQVGQEVDEAARELRETTQEAVQGFEEGVGGAGEHDDEGPHEENEGH